MTIDITSIITAIIISVLAGAAMLLVKKKFNEWIEYQKERDNKQELYYRKVDAMLWSLISVTHSLGGEFEELYKKRMEQLDKEDDAIRRKI